MTSTIEVPISLIKAGDMDAIRELLDNDSLYWEYGVQDANGEIVWSVEDHFVDGDSLADAADYLATFEPGQAKLVRRLVSNPEETPNA